MQEIPSVPQALAKQHPAAGPFSPLSDLDQFRQVFQQFCIDQKYHDIKLTDAQILQLRWYQGNSVITPQASIQEINGKLNFEIKRCLSRLYSFELLLRGDGEAYIEFIQAQLYNPLPREIFIALAKEALHLPEDVKQVIKTTCLLTVSDEAKKVLNEKCGVRTEEYKNDSELFLTRTAVLAVDKSDLFPLTSHLTLEQRKLLLKAYWPNTHLRHMLFTEGPNNMVQSLVDGVKQQKFSREDFQIWKWRWLTNLMGFDAGPGAKYLNEENFALANNVITGLEKLLVEPNTPFLTNYLSWRAKLAGFDKPALNLLPVEQNLLSHLAAYFLKINILNPDLGKFVFDGYLQSKAICSGDALKLANLYESYRNTPDAITPTYLPAVISNALDLFKKDLSTKLLSSANPIAMATLFICQVLNSVYAQPANKLVSCRNLANLANLKGILDEWLKNNMQVQFNVENGELMVASFGPEKSVQITP